MMGKQNVSPNKMCKFLYFILVASLMFGKPGNVNLFHQYSVFVFRTWACRDLPEVLSVSHESACSLGVASLQNDQQDVDHCV